MNGKPHPAAAGPAAGGPVELLEVHDPEGIPPLFEPTPWRVLRDNVANVVVLLSAQGAWTQLPGGVADQLLDRVPGGTGQPPRGLVYLLRCVVVAGWTGPFELRAEPRALANTLTWTAARLVVGPDGTVRPPSRVRVPR